MIDLGITTYCFLFVNCSLLVLGALRMLVAFSLTVTSFFVFAHIKDVTFITLTGEAIFIGLHEYAMFMLGILAGFKNNLRLLCTYEFLLVLLVLSKALSLRESLDNVNLIDEDINLSLASMMNDWRQFGRIDNKVDDIQYFFRCCGLEGPQFWLKNVNSTTDPIPRSCCNATRLPNECVLSNSWPDGCERKLTVPFILFALHYYTLYPGSEVILFFIGLLLIVFIKKTAANSLL